MSHPWLTVKLTPRMIEDTFNLIGRYEVECESQLEQEAVLRAEFRSANRCVSRMYRALRTARSSRMSLPPGVP